MGCSYYVYNSPRTRYGGPKILWTADDWPKKSQEIGVQICDEVKSGTFNFVNFNVKVQELQLIMITKDKDVECIL